MGLGVNASRTAQEATSGAGPVLGLLASSIITLVATASEGIKKSDGFFGELVYGLVVSILTILVVGAVFKMERDAQAQVPKVKLPVMVFFAILWIVAAGLLTFRGPFLFTGNGTYYVGDSCSSFWNRESGLFANNFLSCLIWTRILWIVGRCRHIHLCCQRSQNGAFELSR